MAVAATLGRAISELHLDFPYKRRFITDLPTKFRHLCDYYTQTATRWYGREYQLPSDHYWKGPTVYCGTNYLDKQWHFRQTHVLFMSGANEYEDINVLSDYFQVPFGVKDAWLPNACACFRSNYQKQTFPENAFTIAST